MSDTADQTVSSLSLREPTKLKAEGGSTTPKKGRAQLIHEAVTRFVSHHVLSDHTQATALVRSLAVTPAGRQSTDTQDIKAVVYYMPYYWLYLLTEYDEGYKLHSKEQSDQDFKDECTWFDEENAYQKWDTAPRRVMDFDILVRPNPDRRDLDKCDASFYDKNRWRAYRLNLLDIADSTLSAPVRAKLTELGELEPPGTIHEKLAWEISNVKGQLISLGVIDSKAEGRADLRPDPPGQDTSAQRRLDAIELLGSLLIASTCTWRPAKWNKRKDEYANYHKNLQSACNNLIVAIGRELANRAAKPLLKSLSYSNLNKAPSIRTVSSLDGESVDARRNNNKSAVARTAESGRFKEAEENRHEVKETVRNKTDETRNASKQQLKTTRSSSSNKNTQPESAERKTKLSPSPRRDANLFRTVVSGSSDLNTAHFTRLPYWEAYCVAAARFGCLIITQRQYGGQIQHDGMKREECTSPYAGERKSNKNASPLDWEYWPKCIHKACVQKLTIATLARFIPHATVSGQQGKASSVSHNGSIGVVPRRIKESLSRLIFGAHGDKQAYEAEMERQSEYNKVLAELSQTHLRDTAATRHSPYLGRDAAKLEDIFHVEADTGSLVGAIENRVRHSQHHFNELRRKQARKQRIFRNVAAATVGAFLVLNIASFAFPFIRLTGGVSNQQIQFALTDAQIDSSKPNTLISSQNCAHSHGTQLVDCVRSKSRKYTFWLFTGSAILFFLTLFLSWRLRTTQIGNDLDLSSSE